MRGHLARWLMKWSYRIVEHIDPKAVPKLSPWAFTFERGQGAVINDTHISSQRYGAGLYYINDHDYERAWTDSRSFT